MIPASSQLTLSFEPGLSQRHLSLREMVASSVYARGHGRIATLLDVAPSKLTEKLAGMDSSGKPRGMTVDEFERYLEKSGDLSPIYYLLDKFVRDPNVRQQEALDKLAALADALPALMAAAGLKTSTRRTR